MKQFFVLFVGVILGAVGVVLAQRSAAGREVLERVGATVESLLDGAVEGFRDASR